MPLHVLTQRPDLAHDLNRPELNPGPAVMFNDTTANDLWPRLTTEFSDFQLALTQDDQVIAHAYSVPLAWHGNEHDLPQGGFSWALQQAFDDRAAGHPPTIAVALYIAVDNRHQGQGLSAHMVTALGENAAAHGLTALAAPLRPTLKHRYPLIPMADYATWKRTDGLPYDPWIRTHQRLGARILHPCEEAMHVTGSLEHWRRWAGMDLPGSGEHVVAGALAPVTIDVHADHGTYTEPNLWVWHQLEHSP